MNIKKIKLRILTSTVSYPPYVSGVATVAASINNAMINKGHTVGVIYPSPNGKFQIVKKNNLTEFRLSSFKNPFRLNHRVAFPQRYKIAKIVKEFNPDVIHLHDIAHTSQDLMKNAWRLKIPVIYTHHFREKFISASIISNNNRNVLHRTLEKITSNYIALQLNKTDCIVCPTLNLKTNTRRIGVKVPINVISNGININSFKSKTGKKQKIPVILYLGRIDREKSLDILIRAASVIKSDFKMIIAGHGKELPKLIKLSRKLNLTDKIRFSGQIVGSDKIKLFKNSDIFASASVIEVQSIATMEALASGLPVVAAKAGALPELVFNNQNGLLFKPFDHKSLASKLDLLLSNPKLRKKYGKESLNIIKNHDIKNTFIKYENLFCKIYSFSS